MPNPFSGWVTLGAAIKGNGLKFERFEVARRVQRIERVLLEGPTGTALVVEVFVIDAETPDSGTRLAIDTASSVLDGLSFSRSLAIGEVSVTRRRLREAQNTGENRGEVEVGPFSLSGSGVVFNVVRSTAALAKELEPQNLPHEMYLSLFRTALHASGPVDQFMSLYGLLLFSQNDKQKDVDRFILSNEPAVEQTLEPSFSSSSGRTSGRKMETIYTRLRNEMGHKRPGVDWRITRREMEAALPGLTALVRTALLTMPSPR